MFSWKTSKGSKISLIKVGMTNCYFVQHNNLNLLIDTGPKRFSRKLLTTLKSQFLTNGKLNYLILTHTHFDHSQNAKLVIQEFNPKLIVHQAESECMSKGYTPIPDGTLMITKFIANLGRRFTPQIAKYDAVTPDIIIDNEFLIENKSELKIIETPGHTIGSMSLIIDNEIALVGDTLVGIIKNKVFPPFANDTKSLFKSWSVLFETGCRLYLPAHGKAIKLKLLETNLKK